jgi:hypothetical protein
VTFPQAFAAAPTAPRQLIMLHLRGNLLDEAATEVLARALYDCAGRVAPLDLDLGANHVGAAAVRSRGSTGEGNGQSRPPPDQTKSREVKMLN